MRTLTALALAALTAGAADAQRPGRRAGQPPANRMMLEGQVRQALAARAKEVVGLNDDQMAKLAATDRKFEQQRRDLGREENQTRQALRLAVADSSADQGKVSENINKLLELQRRRTDLLESEQKELATFMTPVQRAKYQALQERVRRFVEQRMGGPPPAGRLRQPPN